MVIIKTFFIILAFISIFTLITADNKEQAWTNKTGQFDKVKYSMNFSGKVALVTGSNSGIGAETVRLLSYLGAQVVVTGRLMNKIRDVAQQCARLSPHNYQPLEVAADLTKSENVKRLIDQTVDKYGRIDILVNSAGISLRAKITDENYLDSFDKVMAINVRAVLAVTQLAIPYLNQTNGTIIFIASGAASGPFPEHSAYGMSKAALVLLTKTLVLELKPNIRVNSISPGYVPGTGITREDPVTADFLKSQIPPLGRNGLTLDIAKGIVFMASPLAEWIDGINLPIQG